MNEAAKYRFSTLCYHCGEQCDDIPVQYEQKDFCCMGCRSAFQILNDNGLCSYYDFETHPGISFKNIKHRKRFNYLENAEIVERMADYISENQIAFTFHIPNIHCTSCVWLLENLQKLDSGVQKSSIQFLKRELNVLLDRNSTQLRDIVELLTTIGYEPEISFEKLDKTETSSNNRNLWLKLGVAGFAFGNIMLFSFPDYLNTSDISLSNEFRIFFGVLNIALALPVLLYSSSDYLKSAFAAIRQKGINLDVPISIGILALFGRSLYEILSGTGAGYMDSFTGLIFFLLIGKLIQKKTFERLSFDRDYKSYLPIAVQTVLKNGALKSVALDALKEGQTIQLRNEELVPTDSILESEKGLIDYSFITGESDPVEIKQFDTVYAGGKILGTSLRLKTIKEVKNSYLTRLWNNHAFSDGDKADRIISFADRISPYFTVSVILIAIISAFYWAPTGMETSLAVFTAVLIIACPCALALSTPFTLGSALNIYALNGLYIKNSLMISKMQEIDTVVFDKTGTLTHSDHQNIEYHGEPLSTDDLRVIKSCAEQSIHPLSRSIANWIKVSSREKPESFSEEAGSGISAVVNSKKVILGSAGYIQSETSCAIPFQSESESFGSVVHIAIDGTYVGFFSTDIGFRTGLKEVLKKFRSRFNTFLVTGDNDSRKKLFAPYFKEEANMLFHQSPEDKLDFIQSLQDNGDKVIMIGDGLNDAGALRKSDFGLAVSDDVGSFSPACDAIIDGDALQKLPAFTSFSKAAVHIIIASFVLSLMYNTVGLGFAVTGHLSPLVAAILMPLSSVSIMAFTFFTTRLKAKQLELAIWK